MLCKPSAFLYFSKGGHRCRLLKSRTKIRTISGPAICLFSSRLMLKGSTGKTALITLDIQKDATYRQRGCHSSGWSLLQHHSELHGEIEQWERHSLSAHCPDRGIRFILIYGHLKAAQSHACPLHFQCNTNGKC